MKAPVVGLLLLVMVTALGCTKSDVPAATPRATVEAETATPEATATATPIRPERTPVPPVATPFSGAMKEQAQMLLNRVGEIRGSPPKSEIEMNLISRQAATDYYKGDGTDEEDHEDTDLQQEVYRLLGLIPESSDLEDEFVRLLGSGITGFYEPRLKAFYLLDDQGGLNSTSGRSTVVHELVHALQDQYYDLDAVSDRIGDNWDAQRAFSSVVEGDAVVTEGLFAGRSLGMAQRGACFMVPPANFGSTPYAVSRDLNSWYNDGSCFVQRVLQLQDGSVGAIFDRLPSTTEQLLHPEKYVASEGAVAVSLKDLSSTLGEGWAKGDENSFGEYGLQNILMLGLSSNRANVQDATAGWGGDRWQIYRKGGDRLLAEATAWDSPQEARQFWDALVSSLRGRAAATLKLEGDRVSNTLGGKEWRAAIRGDSVYFVVGTDATVADAALDALLR